MHDQDDTKKCDESEQRMKRKQYLLIVLFGFGSHGATLGELQMEAEQTNKPTNQSKKRNPVKLFNFEIDLISFKPTDKSQSFK